MKRLLAILLAFVLTLSVALPILATEEEAAPLATHITVEWDGTIPALEWGDLWPRIGLDNVTITVYFDDGSSRVQDNWGERDVWYGKATGIEGGVSWGFIRETGVMTIMYADLYLWQAYAKENGLPDSPNKLYVDKEFRATLPKATIQFPLNYIEVFINSQKPLTTLALDKPEKSASATPVFTFTPSKDGSYAFKSQAPLHILTQGFEEVGSRTSAEKSLRGGETYYVIMRKHTSANENAQVIVSYIAPPTLLQKILQGIFFIPALIVGAFVFPPFPGLMIFILPFLPFILLFGWIRGLLK